MAGLHRHGAETVCDACCCRDPCRQLESERKALQRAAELDKLAAAELAGVVYCRVVRLQTGA
jgi:hypothetical protein